MRTRLFTLLALIFLSTGTLQAQKARINDPIVLNDYYVSITDSLYQLGQQWGTVFNQAYKSKDFNPLIKQNKMMLSFVERKQKEVMNQRDFAGSENLRLALLDFLSYEKRLINEAFLPFEKLKNSATEEQIQAALDKLVDVAKLEKEELLKVETAQREFARRNNFTIEGAE